MTIPAAPTSLTITPGNGQLTIAWNASAGATKYTLYRSAQPNVSKSNGTAIANVTSPYVLQGLTNGTAYYFVVTAGNSAGESPDSAAASGIPVVPSAAPLAVVVARPDANDRGVFPNSTVVVRFNKTIANASTSTVTLTGPGGPVTGTVSSSANTVTFTPSAPLAPESDYTVGLTTGLTDGNAVPLAAPVSWKFTTSSSAPANLRTVVGNHAVTLQWDAVPGATSYAIFRSATPTGTPTVFTARGQSFTDNNATNGLSAYYQVVAQTPFGLTPASSQLLTTPSPSKALPPSTPNATGYRTTALVNWSAVSGATGYTLWRATTSGGPYTSVVTGSSTTTFLDTGLNAGGTYFYVMQTESAAGPSVFSAEVAAVLDAARAPAPGALAATRGYAWLQLTWNAVPSATGYVVFRNDTASDTPSLTGYVPVGTSIDVTGLGNGTTYRHFVGAVVNGLVGDLAEAVAAPGPLFMPQPVTLAIPVASVNRLDLSWTGGSGSTSTAILRSTTSGGPYTAVASANDTTVTAGTRYYYVVRPDNGSAQGQLSNEVSAVPLAAGTPATPTNLAVEATNGALQLRWDPVPGAKQYEVASGTTPGGPYNGSVCFSSETYETRCTLGATNETTLYLVVRSYNGTTYSPYGAEVSATPTAVGATAGLPMPSLGITGGNGALTVGWSTVPNATSYRLFRRSRTSDWVELTAPLSATSFTDTTVTNGVAYRYAVQAVNPTGPRVSAWRTSSEVTPSAKRPLRPTGFTVTPYNGGFQVSWTPVAGASSYSVQAGFTPGSSVYSPATSCSSYGAYESRCTFGASNGTTYYVSMLVSSPQGDGAYSDEVQMVPEPLAPASPPANFASGNGSISVIGAQASGATGYRFYLRTFDTDWQLKGTSPALFFRSDAVNGTPYRLAVESFDASGHTSSWALSGWLTPSAVKPPQVTGLTLTGANGQFLAQWNPIVGVTDYAVLCGGTPGAPMSQRATTSDPFDTRASFLGTNGMPLSCSVEGYGNSGYGDYVAQVTASATSAVPLTPTLTLTRGNQAMGLEWPSVSGATGYRLYRRAPWTDWAQLVTTAGLTWLDERVQNGESFRYAVQAVGPGGDSAWSFSAMGLVDAALPPAPQGVTVRPGNASAQVDWSPVAGATSYALYTSGAQGGPFNYVTTVSGQYESRARLNGTNGNPLWVVVTANNGTGNGTWSTPDTATPSASLPTFTGCSAVAQPAAGTIRLTWSAVSGATGYKVYRRLAQGLPSLINTTTMTSMDDVGLVSGTAYTYYVEVQNAAGSGAWSNPSTATAN
ncbi:MAG: fibronectin type III domain-containing protein [Myxococcaceae bacterium]|nr:fibronectin type III domain-containing protein [Myxococcaceae bacterium]